MIILVKLSLMLSAMCIAYAVVQYGALSHRLEDWEFIMTVLAQDATDSIERRRSEEEKKAKEKERQSQSPFGLDLVIYHGDAIGGCAATLSDGCPRRGLVALDQIKMHGRHPSGGSFTYYIEEEGITIGAGTNPDELRIQSATAAFDIREDGMNKDQRLHTTEAVIQKDILYYVVLESHHEIAISASSPC